MNTKREVSVFDFTLENQTTTERIDSIKTASHVEVTWGNWKVTSMNSLAQEFNVVASVPQLTAGGDVWYTSDIGSHGQAWKNPSGSEQRVTKTARVLEKTHIAVKYFEGKFEQLPFQGNLCYELFDTQVILRTRVQGVYDGVHNTELKVSKKGVASWNESTKIWSEF